MQLIPVEEPGQRQDIPASLDYCRLLEEGNILFFERLPFTLPREDRHFLLSQKQSGAQFHKNISYRPHLDRITGFKKGSEADRLRLLEVMRRYSRSAVDYLGRLLPSYSRDWKLDYASFRPQEEEGRQVRLRARNDLLHIDSFPTRPTQGDRILRFFTNINPHQPRKWQTTDPFPRVIEHLQRTHSIPGHLTVPPGLLARAARALKMQLRKLGFSIRVRSAYDDFMLRFHHCLKENQHILNELPIYSWEFPPGSSWLVFTDIVPHAALSGRFALEQTLIVSRRAQALPETAPAALLRRLGMLE